MAQTGFTPIQLYRTSTAAAVPVNTDLADGELAINTTDEKLYFKNAGGTVKLLAANITPPANGGTGVANGTNNTITFTGDHTLGLTLTGTTAVTLPTTGTLTTLAGTEALSNKDLTAGTNTFPSSLATLTGTQTLTNKTIAFADNTLTGVAGTTATQTLTNKTISGADNTLTVDGTVPVGFRTIPQNSQSGAYTLVLADSGKHIFHPSADTTARTFTIPANSSVAYPIGTALTFINQNGAGVVTIAITTDTMRLSPAGTTGSRTLAANGSATCIKVTATEWLISGSGLT
jgi:hypothetical protein